MATVGLRDLFIAKVTEHEEEPDTYGIPRRLAKMITVDLTPKTADGKLFADDGVDDIVDEFESGEIKLNINDLATDDQAELLGQEQDDDGVVYSSENDDPPYFAVGFRATKRGGRYRYVWLYKVKFAIPSEKYQTKGDKIEFNTPEIVGTFIKRPDGRWKADYVGLPETTAAQNWFSEVRERPIS